MKQLLSSSILLLLICTTSPAVDARRAVSSSSLTSIPRPGLKRAFVETSSSVTPNNAKQVRGGEGGGTATMSNEMFNMVKAVVGVGVLSLPAGKCMDIVVVCVVIMGGRGTLVNKSDEVSKYHMLLRTQNIRRNNNTHTNTSND